VAGSRRSGPATRFQDSLDHGVTVRKPVDHGLNFMIGEIVRVRI